MNITIVGGGNLGHTITGILSEKGHRVNILTSSPFRWNYEIVIKDSNRREIKSRIYLISDKPAEVIPTSELIIICLPGFLLKSVLESIKPFLSRNVVVSSVVSSSGFFWMARKVLGNDVALIGFQRVPFISRIIEYGHVAEITGRKLVLKISCINCDGAFWKDFFNESFDTKVCILSHYLEAALTNSNPILHPARLYGLFKDFSSNSIFDKIPFFYEDWDNYSSEILISADNEFQKLIRYFPINYNEIPSILAYYDSYNADSLTNKIRSISGFKNIKVVMKESEGKFVPDFENRYFTEDIPYGLIIIKSIAILLQLATPTIDELIYWAQNRMRKEYLTREGLNGKDISNSGSIGLFNITSVNKLIQLQV